MWAFFFFVRGGGFGSVVGWVGGGIGGVRVGGKGLGEELNVVPEEGGLVFWEAVGEAFEREEVLRGEAEEFSRVLGEMSEMSFSSMG